MNNNEVGRVWGWQSVKERLNNTGNTAKPDVLLPYGRLFESTMTLHDVAIKLNHIVLLSNKDLVVGPSYLKGEETKEAKEDLAQANIEFRHDMIYLKMAMQHGTIVIENLLKKKEKVA